MPVRCGQGEFFFYKGEIVFDLRALEHDEVLVEKIITRNKINELTTWNSNIEEYYENCYSAGFQIVKGGKLGCKGK